MSDFQSVGDFHRKFGLPAVGHEDPVDPQLIDDEMFLLRVQMIQEELQEMIAGHRARDIAAVADAIADLVYFAHGTAHLYGIPFDEVFAEVQRANMQKERSTGDNDGRSKRVSKFDVVKPEGWTPPDINGVIEQARRMTSMRLSLAGWDRRFYDLAYYVSRWSKDPSTKVGAVLVGTEPGQVALGYNGFPRYIQDTKERLGCRETRLALTQHAERNVLDNAGFPSRGSSLYVTFFPCSECCKSIVQRRVAVVVCPPPESRPPWAEDSEWSRLILREGGVLVKEAGRP